MPGSIEEIKRRLRSVSSIQKITRAMKLIATAKLQKLGLIYSRLKIFICLFTGL